MSAGGVFIRLTAREGVGGLRMGRAMRGVSAALVGVLVASLVWALPVQAGPGAAGAAPPAERSTPVKGLPSRAGKAAP